MRAITLAVLASVWAMGEASGEPIRFTGDAAPATGAIALPVGADGVLDDAGKEIDARINNAIAGAMRAADFNGGARDTLTLYGIGPYQRIVLIGVGDGLKSRGDLEDFGGRAAQALSEGAAPGALHVIVPNIAGVETDAAHAAAGASFANYKYGEAFDRAKPADNRALVFHTANAANDEAAFATRGRALADGVKLARDLISEPSNIKSPQWFVDQTRAAFRGAPGVTIEVLDERQMARLGMGALLGVGQGSTRPPRLLAVRYMGAAADEAPIAFVGKGITFDTGGISLKDPQGMWDMRYDMAGAAASVGAVLSLAKSKAPVNAIAVAALAENMPDGGAIRPGDVLQSMSGKTIEVLNTDAEGRLVLADGLWWVQERHKPRAAITIATLTGAVRTALGDDYAGLFANNDALADAIQKAATTANEPVWPLPIHESVRKDIKADVADVRNVLASPGGPGASIGAAFIQEWVKNDTPWAHLDIAGMAWVTSRTPTAPAGAVGFGVRLFDALARGE
jgi:leucyl aminopeptidase